MSEILCSKTNEFIYKEGGFCFIGVTDTILKQLGQVQYIYLPSVGESYVKGEIFGFLESEKAATELFMPVTGTILEINEKIKSSPPILNSLPIGERWLIKISFDFFDEDKNDLICYND